MFIILRFLFLLSLLTSCSYQFGQSCLQDKYSTMTIPYCGGDKDGRLTAALIRHLSQSGTLEYCNSNGQLTLVVKLLKVRDKNIGFRYDRNRKKDELLDTIIPTEMRRTVFAEVVVIESYSKRVLIGPARISASVDFDHDYYSSRNGINIFSLGQLGDIDAAYDACLAPLYQNLAEKIIDYVNNSW